MVKNTQSLLQQYKASLKDISIEEPLHLYLFRPVAFVLVKLIYRFPLTPNQISFLSMITGIASGIFFFFGDATSFLYGGLLYGFAYILDCVDGMVARLKKTGTPVGRIIDGAGDYVNSVAVYTGFALGLARAGYELPASPYLLVALAGASFILHSIIVDYYRKEFMAHALGKANSVREDIKLSSSRLEKLKQDKGKHFEKLLLRMYIKYSNIQIIKTPKKRKFNRKEYYDANISLLRLWNWIATPTTVLVLVVSSCLYKPAVFFFYILGAANIWMLVLWIIQTRTIRKLIRKTRA